jgi:hypothetical protein
MIAHATKSTVPATALAAKAALRVGCLPILIGLARAIILLPTFLVFFARMKDALGFGDFTDLNRTAHSGIYVFAEGSDRLIPHGAWIGGIVFATVITFILLLSLSREGYAKLQLAKVLWGNSSRQHGVKYAIAGSGKPTSGA